MKKLVQFQLFYVLVGLFAVCLVFNGIASRYFGSSDVARFFFYAAFVPAFLLILCTLGNSADAQYIKKRIINILEEGQATRLYIKFKLISWCIITSPELFDTMMKELRHDGVINYRIDASTGERTFFIASNQSRGSKACKIIQASKT